MTDSVFHSRLSQAYSVSGFHSNLYSSTLKLSDRNVISLRSSGFTNWLRRKFITHRRVVNQSAQLRLLIEQYTWHIINIEGNPVSKIHDRCP